MVPQAVVFDIGNVLIEWQPERFYDKAIGPEKMREMFAAVDLHAMNDRVDLGENIREVVYEAAEQYPEWRAEIRMWNDCWADMATPAIDHSVRLMKALRARGVPVFSLTNFGIETYDLAATHYPFLRDFDRDFISGHMRMIKPNPLIYKTLEESSGIAPEALLFTDDRADNIAGAAARGWQTHLFDGPAGWANRLVDAGLLTQEQAT